MRIVGAAVLRCAAAATGLSACAQLSGIDRYGAADCGTACADETTIADANLGGDESTKVADATESEKANPLDTGTSADTSADRNEGADATSDARADGSDATSADVDAGESGSDAGASALDSGDGASPEGGDGGSVDIDAGLVAYYAFDESSGTSAADSSGNGHTATLNGGATFATGIQGNAVVLDGVNGYVALPTSIVASLTSFSVSSWALANGPVKVWSRIFDFGTDTSVYMFLTPLTSSTEGSALRFAITTGGNTMEEQVNPTSALTAGAWQHVVVTMTGGTATIFVNAAQVAQTTMMTLNPMSLGATTHNWLGHSQFTTDPYFSGSIDNFRIYDRALSTAEIQTLEAGHL